MCFSVLCLTLHYIKQHFVTMHCALARYAEAVDVEHDVLFSLPMNFIWIDYNPCLLLLSRRWCHNIYHRLLQTSSPIGLNLHLSLYQAWHYYVAHARESYYWILWMLSLHLGAFTLYILFLVTVWTECTIPAIPKVEWVPKYKYK